MKRRVFAPRRVSVSRTWYRLGSARTARTARVTVLRGKRVVRRLKARSRRAGRTYRVAIAPRNLRRGT